jgi:hypothetical protein
MVSRYEPGRLVASEIHRDCMQILEQKQWLSFFEKFDGFCEGVALEFDHSFDGEELLLGTLPSGSLKIALHLSLDYLR